MNANRNLIVTGSSGLIGSAVVDELAGDFDAVYGIDNNMRASFFARRAILDEIRED
jgi:nucleoside-diphosphate-sugar epimerase